MSNRKFDAMHSLKEHFSEDQTKIQPKTLSSKTIAYDIKYKNNSTA